MVRNWYARIKALQHKLGVSYFPSERIEDLVEVTDDAADLEGADNVTIDRGRPKDE